MIKAMLMRGYALLVTIATLASLVFVYVSPPPSLETTRDGVPFFTPPVEHPETGEPLDLGVLIRHYKGE